MRVALWLTVGDCQACPYLDVDFDCAGDNCYYCKHRDKPRVHDIADPVLVGKESWYTWTLRPVVEVAKTCPLKKLAKKK